MAKLKIPQTAVQEHQPQDIMMTQWSLNVCKCNNFIMFSLFDNHVIIPLTLINCWVTATKCFVRSQWPLTFDLWPPNSNQESDRSLWTWCSGVVFIDHNVKTTTSPLTNNVFLFDDRKLNRNRKLGLKFIRQRSFKWIKDWQNIIVVVLSVLSLTAWGTYVLPTLT